MSVDNFKKWFDEKIEAEPIRFEEKIIMRQTIISLKMKEISQIHREHNSGTSRKLLDLEYSKIISLKSKEIVKESLKAICFTLLTIITMVFYWKPSRQKDKFNLVFGLPDEHCKQGNLNQLSSFFLDSRIPISGSGTYIFQNGRINNPLRNKNRFKFVFRVEIFLISTLNTQDRIVLMKEVLSRFHRILVNLKANQSYLMCSRQYLFETAVLKVSQRRNKIASLSTTNSTYIRQHSGFYLFFNSEIPSFMFWYSENSHPKLFNEGSTAFDYGNFRDIYVKEHLVWTSEFAQFIQGFTKEKVTPIGSILFYQNTSPKNVAKEFDVLIFDVTPYHSASKNEFYSVDNCVNYIELLGATLKNEFGNSIKVGIKQKRKITSAHSEKYVNIINMQDWIFQPHNANLYELINRSKCVIGIPYTSAVLVALELKIPCYYFFDSTTIDLPKYFNGIQVLRSAEELRHVLHTSVSKGRGYE